MTSEFYNPQTTTFLEKKCKNLSEVFLNSATSFRKSVRRPHIHTHIHSWCWIKTKDYRGALREIPGRVGTAVLHVACIDMCCDRRLWIAASSIIARKKNAKPLGPCLGRKLKSCLASCKLPTFAESQRLKIAEINVLMFDLRLKDRFPVFRASSPQSLPNHRQWALHFKGPPL